MVALPKTQVEFTKITGPYPLLALFLLVAEGLLGFWLFKTEGVPERLVAGTLMVLLMAGFLVAILRMQGEKTSGPIPLPNRPNETINPASRESTTREIEHPEPQSFVGPDGYYTINKPPKDWKIRNITQRELSGIHLGITDPSTLDKLSHLDVVAQYSTSQVSEIVQFMVDQEYYISPTPGKTRLNGKLLPTALGLSCPIQLVIQPLERMQPPWYLERSFEETFLITLVKFLGNSPSSMHSLKLDMVPGSRRRRYTAELRQELQDATLNGREEQSITINMVWIGIEGDVRDHLLRINYPSVSRDGDILLEHNVQVLKALVDSFRPLELLAPDQKRTELKHVAEKGYNQTIAKHGRLLFSAQLHLLMLRFKGWNLEDPEVRLRAMRQLKPFESLAQQVQYEHPDLIELWDSLHRAEQGDASDFKAKLLNWIAVMSTKGDITELLPTRDMTQEQFFPASAPGFPHEGKGDHHLQ